MSEIENRELGYNLKKPCKDCPFRKDVPVHEGVASDLMAIWGKVEMGRFAHSCHKTDARSDGFIQGYDKGPEHCAGALIMLKNMGAEAIQDHWVIPSTWRKIKAIKKDPAVFESLTAMIKHYANKLQDNIGLQHSVPED
jgi:hypothetical protein